METRAPTAKEKGRSNSRAATAVPFEDGRLRARGESHRGDGKEAPTRRLTFAPAGPLRPKPPCGKSQENVRGAEERARGRPQPRHASGRPEPDPALGRPRGNPRGRHPPSCPRLSEVPLPRGPVSHPNGSSGNYFRSAKQNNDSSGLHDLGQLQIRNVGWDVKLPIFLPFS